MIDAGDVPERNQLFLQNLKTYFSEFKAQYDRMPYVSKILLTHAHHDHMGGLFDVLQCLKDHAGQQRKPRIYKMLNDNRFEAEIFERWP